MAKDNYLKISGLAKSLSKGANKLEKGKLSVDELSELLDNSRDIYERLTILRYKSIFEKQELEKTKVIETKPVIKLEEKEKEKEEESGITFKFDVVEDNQEEISPNQKNLLDEIQEIGIDSSINELYASTESKESVAEKMTKSKISDLREGIALNQKFLFMNDLFQGDKNHYDTVLDKLNKCETITEAKAYLASEVENNFKWDNESSSVLDFISLLERKFS